MATHYMTFHDLRTFHKETFTTKSFRNDMILRSGTEQARLYSTAKTTKFVTCFGFRFQPSFDRGSECSIYLECSLIYIRVFKISNNAA